MGWFGPDHLKEGTYITGGSGGVALINKAPASERGQDRAQLVALARGANRLSEIFTRANDGPDSLRIDIPKDKVPRGNRRPEGDENRYPFVDRAEWMDQEPIRKFIKEALAQRK